MRQADKNVRQKETDVKEKLKDQYFPTRFAMASL